MSCSIHSLPASRHDPCQYPGRDYPLANALYPIDMNRNPAAGDGEIRKLTDLLEVSQTLGSTLNLKSALTRVLEILEERHGAAQRQHRAARRQRRARGRGRGRPRAGRRRAARATASAKASPAAWSQSGRPVVVPQVSHEPLFLNRTGVSRSRASSEMTYICVPVTVDDAHRRRAGRDAALRQGRAATTARRSSSASWPP